MFEASVAAQADAIGRGDADAANRHAKAYMAAFEVARRGCRQDALVRLLGHGRPGSGKVRDYLQRYRIRRPQPPSPQHASKGMTKLFHRKRC